jgi:hypothetical protein
MKKISFMLAMAALPLIGPNLLGSSDVFSWLDLRSNTPVFQEIKKAFSDELRPDIPVKGSVPILHKYLAHIGTYKDSCLVIIGYRETSNSPKDYDFFRAFSYDRNEHRKSEILPNEYYYRWSFIGEKKFESSLIPDLVFKYYDCLECEAVELLSSFRFDQRKNKWQSRIWPDGDPRLMIGSDNQLGDDVWIYDCLYSIQDFNSDGYEDIAIRCRETGEKTKKTKDELFLYTIQQGKSRAIKVTGQKMLRINRLLCSTQSSPLCKKRGK